MNMNIRNFLITLSLLVFSSVSFAQAKNIFGIQNEHDAKIIAKTFSNGNPVVLYNFVLQKKIKIKNPLSLSAEDAGQYIPQINLFLDSYVEYLKQGKNPFMSAMLAQVSPKALAFIKESKH